MIVRIVKMKFKEEHSSRFIEIYKTVKPFILKCKGCIAVNLLIDVNDSRVMSTISEWETENDLNQYRDSELFGITWSEVKQLFEDKPQANSYNKLESSL
ncbi:MAG: antibiotic biosynthesis monooxygenase [Saprospiraceae bacterium]|nr:antibiotic biosynthesis monooxygenase [Saprospiraceae bacterium]